jgi:hypothetical protein
MFRTLNTVAIAGAMAAAVVLVSPAQADVGNCVQQYYDQNHYNWLAFRNGCGQSIYVVFVRGDNGGSIGAMNLGPGRHDSTGLSSQEVSSKGGIRIAVCAQGEVPISTRTRRYWTNGNDRFFCKDD